MNDPKMKQQAMERHSGPSKRKIIRFQIPVGKNLASIFWGCQEVIMTDFLDESRTIIRRYLLFSFTGHFTRKSREEQG